jgi:hypothetical protein
LVDQKDKCFFRIALIHAAPPKRVIIAFRPAAVGSEPRFHCAIHSVNIIWILNIPLHQAFKGARQTWIRAYLHPLGICESVVENEIDSLWVSQLEIPLVRLAPREGNERLTRHWMRDIRKQ